MGVIKEGDRVMVTPNIPKRDDYDPNRYYDSFKTERKGTVLYVAPEYKKPIACVEFDKPCQVFHSASGRGRENHCWFVAIAKCKRI